MTITNKNNYSKEEICMNEHIMEPMVHKPKRPVPPHERKGFISIQFDDDDWSVFNEAFGDEDTAAAAVDIIHGAPSEIQVLVAQLLKMIEKEAA